MTVIKKDTILPTNPFSEIIVDALNSVLDVSYFENSRGEGINFVRDNGTHLGHVYVPSQFNQSRMPSIIVGADIERTFESHVALKNKRFLAGMIKGPRLSNCEEKNYLLSLGSGHHYPDFRKCVPLLKTVVERANDRGQLNNIINGLDRLLLVRGGNFPNQINYSYRETRR